jgi:hypothetical protein
MDHKNIRGFKLTAFVPGDESDNAWAAMVTNESGEQRLLSFSQAVAGQMFAQIGAAMCDARANSATQPFSFRINLGFRVYSLLDGDGLLCGR